MSLGPGSTVGPFKIQSLIGKGGMGEVFSAVDTRLERSVAIKVLPPEFSSDSEVRARFEREARAISNLTHPHICTLYDIGRENGTDYLVMERLEGQTLAERLKKGRLPLEQALEYGIQIAAALDRAHRAGIVHRDLKPGNIMLTKNGVKLLDFGLAKFSGKTQKAAAEDQPTLLEKTTPGMIFGTLQYMAPEQVEGGEVDHRTDIFALGCVLYEMVTGQKAFEGNSPASVMAAILQREPAPAHRVQPFSPHSLDRFLKHCLAKSPEDRWQTAHDVKLELEDLRHELRDVHAPVKASRAVRITVSASVLLAAALGASLVLTRRDAALRQETIRFEIAAPEAMMIEALTVSPDGSQIVFQGVKDGQGCLYVRSLGSLTVRKLEGTENAVFPFWSPDSRQVGFFADGNLKRMNLADGTIQTVAPVSAFPRGGSWSKDGTIIFNRSAPGPLFRVSASGGEVKQISVLDTTNKHVSHRFPWFLPDGKHFIFLARGGSSGHGESSGTGIYLGALGTERIQQVVQADYNAAFVPPDNLVFVRNGALFSQKFDVSKKQLLGTATLLVPQVGRKTGNSEALFSVSQNGVLAFKGNTVSDVELVWYDRSGQEFPLAVPAGDWRSLALSQNNRRVAFIRSDVGASDVWVLDIESGSQTRITTEPAADNSPVWATDSQSLFFVSRRDPAGIYRHVVGRATRDELVYKMDSASLYLYATDISPNGKFILLTEGDAARKKDIAVLSLDGELTMKPFRTTPFAEGDAVFSPDGKWVAYYSDESGDYQLYLQSFPDGVQRHGPISRGQAAVPRWNPRGGELFFLSPVEKRLYSIKLKTEPEVEVNPPEPLFNLPKLSSAAGYTSWQFGVNTNGDRFLFSRSVHAETNMPITVVLNWPEQLRKESE